MIKMLSTYISKFNPISLKPLAPRRKVPKVNFQNFIGVDPSYG